MSAAARLAATLADEGAPPASAPKPAARPHPAPHAEPPPATRPPRARPATGRPSAALDAFFRGAGSARAAARRQASRADAASPRPSHARADLGTQRESALAGRAEKRAARPDPTNQPQDKNPLSVSASVDEAIANLLFRPTSEFLQAVESVREAFTDIKQHQQSLLERAAYRGRRLHRAARSRGAREQGVERQARRLDQRGATSSSTGTSTRTCIRSSRKPSRASFRSNSWKSSRAPTRPKARARAPRPASPRPKSGAAPARRDLRAPRSRAAAGEPDK